MSSSFVAVNCTKCELVDPNELSGRDQFYDWCNEPNQAGLLAYLLRKSDKVGHGDIQDLRKVRYAGRWAGDEIYLIGDADSSLLYLKASNQYADITSPLVKEYCRFMDTEFDARAVARTLR